jgi:hypothetical protein
MAGVGGGCRPLNGASRLRNGAALGAAHAVIQSMARLELAEEKRSVISGLFSIGPTACQIASQPLQLVSPEEAPP